MGLVKTTESPAVGECEGLFVRKVVQTQKAVSFAALAPGRTRGLDGAIAGGSCRAAGAAWMKNYVNNMLHLHRLKRMRWSALVARC